MAINKKRARTINFDADIDQLLEKHMKARNLRNVSQVVNAAVRFALVPESRDDSHHDLSKLYHQILYSLNEHRKKTARDLAANQETQLQFILECFKRIPAPEEADDGRALQELDALMTKVAKNLGKSKLLPPLDEEET